MSVFIAEYVNLLKNKYKQQRTIRHSYMTRGKGPNHNLEECKQVPKYSPTPWKYLLLEKAFSWAVFQTSFKVQSRSVRSHDWVLDQRYSILDQFHEQLDPMAKVGVGCWFNFQFNFGSISWVAESHGRCGCWVLICGTWHFKLPITFHY